MQLTSKEMCSYMQGKLLVDNSSEQNQITDIVWDSRNVIAGDAYIAFPGENVDGNDFAGSALDKGAACVVCTRLPEEDVLKKAEMKNASVILVDDAFEALDNLAFGWRRRLQGTVIAITGSTGKTTTKNLIRDILSQEYSVVATKGNQNNEIGAPKTILNASEDTDFIVVEMGMCGFNEIRPLCSIAQPELAIITNVGESHIELLGSRENIARAKSEIAEQLPEKTGRLFLNAGDGFAEFIQEITHTKQRGIDVCLYDGSGNPGKEAKVFATNIQLSDEGKPEFTLHIDGEEIHICLGLRGLHNVWNACAAAAVASSLGISIEKIAQVLAQVKPEPGRQEILHTKSGMTVINDSYNANPESMAASLNMFASMKVKGKRIAVLGDMAELGDFAQAGHERMGSLAAQLPIDALICVGSLARFIASSARKSGFNSEAITEVDSVEEALDAVRSIAKDEDTVLVKASNSTGLKYVVEGLVD